MLRKNAPGSRRLYVLAFILQEQITDMRFIGPGQEYLVEEKESSIGEIRWSYDTMPDSSEGDLASISSASCKVTGDYTTQLQVVSILSWLCAAVRSSGRGGVSSSSVSVKGEHRNEGSRIFIELDPLEPVQPNGTCWHEVFPHGVIAKDFAIPHRKVGQGLEIAFADMALVCGCLGIVEFKQGLVVDGLNSILIPRKFLLEDDALQWHFESKIRVGGRTAYTSDVLESVNMEPWHNEGDPVLPADLLAKRCFLAWAEKTHIMVGTEEHFNSNTISDSEAKISDSTKYVRSYALNLGGNVGHFTFGFNITATPTSMPAFLQSSLSNSIHDILRNEEACGKGNHFVLFFDTDTNIGWYLPQACVVLHMARQYISEQKYELIDAEERTTLLEFAKPDGSADVGAIAASILHKSLAFRTRRWLRSHPLTANGTVGISPCLPLSSSTTKASAYEDFHFKNTVERLWYLLDTVGSTLKMNRSEYMKCSEMPPNGIHGVDFKELLEPKGPEKVTSIRYVKFYQPWSYLTNDQSTVIFCKNLGQAIVPTTRGLCDPWLKVPKNKNYLVMTGQTIHYFLRKNSSGLSKELKWHMNEILIQGHHEPHEGVAIHTQQLKAIAGLSKLMDRIGGTNRDGTPSNVELMKVISPQSCLVFTGEQGRKCYKAAAESPIQQEYFISPRETGSKTAMMRTNSTAGPLLPALPTLLVSQAPVGGSEHDFRLE
jgi:hypothetical protein